MKRPTKNAIAFLIGDVGSRLLGFTITAYIARVLSPEGFGMVSIGFAALGQLALLASPGISLLETRNAAAAAVVPPERTGGVISLRLFLSILICTVTWGVVRWTSGPGSAGPITLLYVTSLLPMALSLEWLFQGKERMGVVSASRIGTYLVYGIAVLFLVRGPGDVTMAAASFLAGSWAGSLLLMFAYGSGGRIDLRWRPALMLRIFRENLPVGAGMFLGQLVVNLPAIILAFFVPHGVVGSFGAAAKVVFLFLMIDRLFNSLFLPILTRHLTSGGGSPQELFRVALKGVVILISGLAGAGVIAAPLIIRLVFGGAYESATPLLQIMMAYFLLTVVNSVFICAIMAAGRTGAYLRVTAIGGGVLTVALLLGIWFFGAEGAAYGMVVGEAASVLVALPEARKLFPFRAMPVLAAAAVSIIGLFSLPFVISTLGIWGGIGGAGALLYASTLIVGGVSRKEFLYLKERLV